MLALVREWDRDPREACNVDGSAIALGHPLGGATSLCIMTTMPHALAGANGNCGLRAISFDPTDVTTDFARACATPPGTSKGRGVTSRRSATVAVADLTTGKRRGERRSVGNQGFATWSAGASGSRGPRLAHPSTPPRRTCCPARR
ncbi:hypothetical protein [Nocardia nepalensis]|uniref:hypothetical protein n=1 Tax=Nocardia nepalensis TaxID=3375448 RepID=UPI003B6845B8